MRTGKDYGIIPSMARRQQRTISPKFILFCASVFILVIAVVILVFVITLQRNNSAGTVQGEAIPADWCAEIAADYEKRGGK